MERFMRFPGGKAKALTFSYDDGKNFDAQLVEIFRKYSMRGTFNICSGLFGNENRRNALTISEALKVYTDDVCEVACHTVHHPVLSDTNTIDAWNEVLEDRKNLEKIFGRQIHGMAYPFGVFSDTIVQILKNAGIFYSRTTKSTLKFDIPNDWLRLPTTCHHNNPALMDLADKFLSTKVEHSSKLFFVWGHSFEFDRNNNWSVIEEFCKKMAFKDDIWYATNIELYYAWLDYQRLETSADGNNIHNPGCRSVWIGDTSGNSWEIMPGESITLE